MTDSMSGWACGKLRLADGAIISFESGKLSDLDEMIKVDISLFPPEVSYDAGTLYFYLIDDDTDVVVARTADGELAGFIIFRPKSETTGCIVTLDVVEKFQRNGIGSKFLEIAGQIRASDACSAIELQVSVHNQNAIRFYEKRGYARTGRLKGYYEDGGDAWEMRFLSKNQI